MATKRKSDRVLLRESLRERNMALTRIRELETKLAKAEAKNKVRGPVIHASFAVLIEQTDEGRLVKVEELRKAFQAMNAADLAEAEEACRAANAA